MTETDNLAIVKAFDTLKSAMQADHSYAWSWHCNIAMGFYDVGGDHWIANQGAARFMQIAFAIDTARFPEYQSIAEQYV